MQELESRRSGGALCHRLFTPSKRTDFESFAAVTSSKAGLFQGCSVENTLAPLHVTNVAYWNRSRNDDERHRNHLTSCSVNLLVVFAREPGSSTQRGLFVLDKISDGAALAALVIVAGHSDGYWCNALAIFSWVLGARPDCRSRLCLIKFSSRIPRRIRDRCV